VSEITLFRLKGINHLIPEAALDSDENCKTEVVKRTFGGKITRTEADKEMLKMHLPGQKTGRGSAPGKIRDEVQDDMALSMLRPRLINKVRIILADLIEQEELARK